MSETMQIRFRTLVVLDAGHFVWEEAPGEYATLVADRVAGGYRAAVQAGVNDTRIFTVD
jgi:hypothetical protein